MTAPHHWCHDDVIKWKHFPRYWPFVRGIHRSPVNSPHRGQWRGTLMFTLICARINGSVNNGEAGDLRRNRAHYDVIATQRLPKIRICFHPRKWDTTKTHLRNSPSVTPPWSLCKPVTLMTKTTAPKAATRSRYCELSFKTTPFIIRHLSHENASRLVLTKIWYNDFNG